MKHHAAHTVQSPLTELPHDKNLVYLLDERSTYWIDFSWQEAKNSIPMLDKHHNLEVYVLHASLVFSLALNFSPVTTAHSCI